MRRFFLPVALAATLTLIGANARALVRDLYVPTAQDPTLQDAVNDATMVNADLTRIWIVDPVIHISAQVLVTAPFTGNRRLSFQPLAALGRATVMCDAPTEPAFKFTSGGQHGFCTVSDLDILRDVANYANLIEMDYGFTDVTFERCRLGSIEVPGSLGHTVILMDNPFNDVVRNCMVFSSIRGTFDTGIRIQHFPNDGSALLYNNTVSDYGVVGIDVRDNNPATTIVLRNNVVANNPDFPATSEPLAWHSAVTVLPGPVLETSGNVAFASAAHVQQVDVGCRDVLGGGAEVLPQSQLANTADPSTAFKIRTWILGDPNAFFYHLWEHGLLHDGAEDIGTTVTNGSPAPSDLEVVDDIDRDPRPAGPNTGHTDRGADQVQGDQLEAAALAVGAAHPGAALEAAPGRNPARDVGLRYRAGSDGALRFEIFDAAGRLLHTERRTARAGEAGALNWSPGRVAGVLLWRATLESRGRAPESVSGRMTIIR